MNYLPTQKYREANLKIKSENDNPYEIVLDVLNELRNNIATLAYCFETDSGIFDIRSKSFSKSLTAIYILQKSLDFDKGGDIANNLFDLYEFCRKSLLSGYKEKSHEKISEILPVIDNILDGWKGIK